MSRKPAMSLPVGRKFPSPGDRHCRTLAYMSEYTGPGTLVQNGAKSYYGECAFTEDGTGWSGQMQVDRDESVLLQTGDTWRLQPLHGPAAPVQVDGVTVTDEGRVVVHITGEGPMVY